MTASPIVGRPRVSVPVLSKTTVSTRAACSRASALRSRIPASAARPVPTMIAVGVARPSAHGQAMTTTAMNAVRARVVRGSGPATSQIAKVSPATIRTSGTKTSLIRSTSRWIGAFEPCARWTRSMIEARTVSRPTRVARITTLPERVQGGADQLVTGRLVDRQGLAGQHRLVDRGPTLDDDRRRRGPSRRTGPGAGRRPGPRRAGRPPRDPARSGGPSGAGGRSAGGSRRRSGPWPGPRASGPGGPGR